PEKISNLNKFLGPLGYHIRGDREGVKPWHLQQVAQAVAGKPEARAVNMAMLRSLKHARYAPQSLGHFGLAKQYYCHFTSPIRRYPDLVVHRVLREVMEKGALSPRRYRRWQEMIHAYAQRSSERERAAEEAERDSVDMKKVEYMERHVGGVFSGFISGVTAYGFYVELENTVEGLVHISTLTDDYYRFDEEHLSLVGQHTGRTFRLGDPVQVRVLRADRATRQIDMELAQPGIKAIHAGKLDSSLIAPGGG
ncbi:MAG: RNB domain-containing ribonuclease, partial [Clostridia bacterium]|nr:RNB domain-containing ribonuclease [Clostridia bacterium]